MSASEQNKTSVRFQFLGIRSEATAAHPSRSFNPSASDLAASEPEARQPAAMTALARRLLVGRDAPFDPQRALALILSAKALGDAEAPLLEATLAAAGAWRPQSWTDALDLLAIAADRGAVLAQGQLRLLAGCSPEGRTWRDLCDRVDVAAWLQAPPRKPVCEAPRIRTAEGFVSPAVCDWLIARARGNLRRAKMVSGYGETPRFMGGRTNSDFMIDIVAADVVISLLRAKISALINQPAACFEPPQILHYAVGEELKPHFDFIQRSPATAASNYQGDRVATFLLYLNDDYDGGETDFPRAPFRHKGAKGDAIVFANVDPSGRPDPMTLHAGLAPTRGEKWLFSQWVHDLPYTYVGPA